MLTVIPSSSKALRDVDFGGTSTEVPSRVAGLPDELMVSTLGIGVPREIEGLSFDVWNPDHSPNLWGALMDIAKRVGGPHASAWPSLLQTPHYVTKSAMRSSGASAIWRAAFPRTWLNLC